MIIAEDRVFGRNQKTVAAIAQIAKTKADALPRCIECVRRANTEGDDSLIRNDMERRVAGWLRRKGL